MIHSNLNGCKRVLKQWVRKNVDLVEQQINEKLEVLHSIQMLDSNDIPEQEAPVKQELHALLKQEEFNGSSWGIAMLNFFMLMLHRRREEVSFIKSGIRMVDCDQLRRT